MTTTCPECSRAIADDETVVIHGGNVYHIPCRDRVRHRHYECRTDLPAITSMKTAGCARCRTGIVFEASSKIAGQRVCGVCYHEHILAEQQAEAKRCAERQKGPGSVSPIIPTISYTLTPQRFVLEIPVEALPALSQDAHTRMLDMLNAWILRHKPTVVKDAS